jgi:diguanylate cyclase (GGDEF)-like protein/PAS domain S-box-containing protein
MKRFLTFLRKSIADAGSLARRLFGSDADDLAMLDAIKHSPKATILVDARTLLVLSANESFCRAVNLSATQLRHRPIAEIFDAPQAQDVLLTRLRDPDPSSPFRAHQRSGDGRLVEVEVTGYSITSGQRFLLVFVSQDVSVRRKWEARQMQRQVALNRLAHHDSLTGLPNRTYLAAHFPDAIEEARRKGQLLGLLFLDLDHFKDINDSRGHDVGDRLLKSVARAIAEVRQEQDMVVRMGGDEFVIVLNGVETVDQVTLTAHRLLDSLSRPFQVGEHALGTGVSIGGSVFPRDGADMSELLRHADTAMYQAKARGRNNFQMFSPLMDKRLKRRTSIDSHLRAALKDGQLQVHYQPIVDLESQCVIALESLLRWRHPTHGYIAPSQFIKIAEESGLIVPIGEFVLEQVMQDLCAWRANGSKLVPVAMNVSAIQLQRSNLPELIMDKTRRHRLESDLLHVELTESTLFEGREGRNGELNEDAVSRLRELGVHISIDDFGTGYSSLSYLKRWRFDSIKIDRSFIRDLVTDPNDLAIVGAITAMARHLNIPVIAEGIEGWQQLAKLRELGCQIAQGYLFSKAVPAFACRPYLLGNPVHFGAERARSGLQDSTGAYPSLMSDLLMDGGR